MNQKPYSLRSVPLGIPLLVASLGTIVPLFMGSKRLHIGFGAAWGMLSLLHGWQHAQKMKRDLARAQSHLSR